MPRIQLPTDQRIPEASRAVVDGIRTQLGFLPNVVKLMSVSPAVSNGWLGLQAALAGRLDRRTREAIALVVSEVNGCAYCLEHTAAPPRRARRRPT
jgi:alkylhydroperoxidase family enzyme